MDFIWLFVSHSIIRNCSNLNYLEIQMKVRMKEAKINLINDSKANFINDIFSIR